MSVSLSIFEKLCPACASAVSVSAARCDCGHVFDANAQESALRDEELYENYLAARAAQAQEAAHAAGSDLANNPDDAGKVATAELAREVAKSLNDDLAQQRAKVTAMRAEFRKKSGMVHSAPIEMPGMSALGSKPAAAQPPVTKPTKPSTVSVAATSATNQTISTEPAPLINPATAIPSKAPAPVAESTAVTLSSATRAASVLETIKTAKARELAARADEEAMRHREAVEASQNTAPPAAFRAEQAARAEKALAARRDLDNKDCPNCTASVPTNTSRCRCGFVFFAGKDDLPSLTLCTGDFTALRDSLNLNLRRS